MAILISTNPAENYAILGKVAISTDKEIKEKVRLANLSKTAWKNLGVKTRIKLLKSIAAEFKKRTKEMALLISNEIGKPITESTNEAIGLVEEFDWFLNHAESALVDEITHEDKKFRHKIVYEPFGVAAVITPWNYPVEMAIWGTVPNLIAGNTVILKISEECPLAGKIIEEIFNKHPLPLGVFNEVYGNGQVGEKLANSAIDLLWFTGSSRVGQHLYQIAASKFIKVILEMGGSNPGIVFDDVDIKSTVQSIYDGRFHNNGQVCDALKRLIVHESIVEEIVAELSKLLKTKKIGDPLDSKTDLGSLAAKRQVDLLKSQVQDALDKGAKLIIGGNPPTNLKGAFYLPTILTEVTAEMRVWKEEVFGPVLPVVTFKTEEEAIKLANDTIYGLGSKIFSKDLTRATRIAAQIEAGSVEINQASRWLPCNPFGGYKKSGMGREHGNIGFRELCQIKVVSEEK